MNSPPSKFGGIRPRRRSIVCNHRAPGRGRKSGDRRPNRRCPWKNCRRAATKQKGPEKTQQRAGSVSRPPLRCSDSAPQPKPLPPPDRRPVCPPSPPPQPRAPPLAVVGAQDEFLHLADGRRVIDG